MLLVNCPDLRHQEVATAQLTVPASLKNCLQPNRGHLPSGDKGTKDEHKGQKTCQKLSQGGTTFGEICVPRPIPHSHRGVRLQLDMSHILAWFLFLPVLLPPPPMPLEQWLSMPGPRPTPASPGHC